MKSKNTPLNAPPRHVAIIMDGNNRWAKQRMLPSLAGHKAGVGSVRAVIEACVEQEVGALTLFAFSSENWKRPPVEVNGLMELFVWALEREVKKLKKHNVRLRIIGEKRGFSEKLQQKIAAAEELTQECTGLQLNVAANYGGRWDVMTATQAIAQKCVDGELKVSDITEETISAHLSLADLPDPDLCIRTAGEQRISNFLIWQCAYTEFYYAKCFWPDFDKNEFKLALESFMYRERRFGKTSEQLEAERNA
ncbi:MAG: isoprenyl transferase [Pontibacterium sp.]